MSFCTMFIIILHFGNDEWGLEQITLNVKQCGAMAEWIRGYHRSPHRGVLHYLPTDGAVNLRLFYINNTTLTQATAHRHTYTNTVW